MNILHIHIHSGFQIMTQRTRLHRAGSGYFSTYGWLMRHIIIPSWVYYKHTVHYTTDRKNYIVKIAQLIKWKHGNYYAGT